MDIICLTCGEPWDLETVLHEDPNGFKRRGCQVTACPTCNGVRPAELSPHIAEKLDDLKDLAKLFGSDLDGFACFLEDHNSD